MSNQRVEAGQKVLHWYRKNKRDLPWRHTNDPYKIWISEIMLQQTRVDTVINYYHQFLSRFPGILSLANATEQEVFSLWQGLGYYSRARNLHRAAAIIQEKYGGVFPTSYDQLRSLPGIGDYTAGAIMSIAFDQPFPAVDGNVLRVISRIEGLEEDISLDQTKKKISSITAEMIPKEAPGDFCQALMELGALICIPGNPVCPDCPVVSLCHAHQTGRQDKIPVKKKPDKPVKEIPCWVAVIENEGSTLMEYRKDDTLLARMWGFPIVEKSSSDTPTKLLDEKYHLELRHENSLGTVKHVFTHQVWKMDISVYSNSSKVDPSSTLHWIPNRELNDLAIPTAFRRVLTLLNKQQNEWEQLSLKPYKQKEGSDEKG